MVINTPVFNEELHTYTDSKDGFKYLSVTKWLEQFKPVFDELAMAKKIANREGVTIELILEEWKTKRDNSKVFGTAVHKELEFFHKTKKIKNKQYEPVINNFKELRISLDEKNSSFEKLVFNKKLGIAGTSDIIIKNKDNKTFNVFDFKTNKKLRLSSPFNSFLLGPLSKYPNVEYFVYSLQVSMYAYLYKLMSGLEPLRLKLFWYNREEPENYNNLKGKWEVFNVPYMEEDILKCLYYEKTVVE